MGLTGSRDVTEEEPWCLVPSELETWYNENIQRGTANFDDDCRRAVDNVVRNVHSLCSKNDLLFDVDRVVKGGSLGKGTMVKDLSDVDLVAFINPPFLQPIVTLGSEAYKAKLLTVIRDLKTALVKQQTVTDVTSNPFLVNFKIKVNQRTLEVDLLPTSDNCVAHGRVHSDMFKAMLQYSDSDREFYSASLAENQLEFVKKQPGYVKELIRLVKYWANDYLPEYLQKSYRLELITIHLWQEAGKPIRFSKAQGLKNVLEVLTNLMALRVYKWNHIYDASLAQKAMTQLGMHNPIVLDPANPTNNVCWLYQKQDNMKVIAGAAGQTLQTKLLRNVTVHSNWKG